MAQPKLTIRSTKAHELAHRLARREGCSIADIVERALEAYAARDARHEPAASFYAPIARDYGIDVDLDAVIRENRQPYTGPDL